MGSFHINPDSPLGQELAKHEQHRTKYVGDEQQPGNAYVYRHYPKMLYRAVANPKTGKAMCMDVPPNPMLFQNAQEYDRACQATEHLNQTCTRVVGNDAEERNAMNEGWRDSPVTALAAFADNLKTVADEAAQRNYRDQGMTPSAKAEVAALEQTTHEQIPDVQVEAARRARKA